MSDGLTDSLPEDAAGDSVWEAYEYVAGGLSAEAETAFEERLAGDQSLREIVARVVETCAAVRTIEARSRLVSPEPPRPQRILTTKRVAGALAASLVFGLVALQSGLWGRGNVEPDSQAGRGDTGVADVAITDDVADAMVAFWSADSPEDDSLVADDEGSRDDELNVHEYAEETSSEFVVPGWMLAAVAPADMDEMLETAPDAPPHTPSEEF